MSSLESSALIQVFKLPIYNWLDPTYFKLKSFFLCGVEVVVKMIPEMDLVQTKQARIRLPLMKKCPPKT